VFWVHASNAARFEQSFHDIADCVKIAEQRDPQANVFKLVHDWLWGSKGQWLLVLDNLDNARYLFEAPIIGRAQHSDDSRTASRPLHRYLPQCERGSILVTSRNKDTALKLVDEQIVISVGSMDEAQAQVLCKKKLGVQRDHPDVAELAKELEYMPLAIVQAAAYISRKVSGCSVAEYLDKFKKNERERIRLLDRDKSKHHRLRRDEDAKNTIFTTWEISFNHIQHVRPSAADLLSLMSFFDRQGIPKDVLRCQAEQEGAQLNQEEHIREDVDSDEEDDMSQISRSEDDLAEDLEMLDNFCLISVTTDNRTFEMHALVQLATRKWLATRGKLEWWKQQFVSNLHAAFPSGEYENWAACEALFAHAKSAIKLRPKSKSSLMEWAALLYRAAWYVWRKGNTNEATELARSSMKARREVLGPEHEDTLSSLGMLALALSMGGQWDEAAMCEQTRMEASKKVLGLDHFNTLTSMSNLALTYWQQGRWDAAEELQIQVMETRKKQLGVDSPITLKSMGSLASTYQAQGRLDDAEELEVQVMDTLKKICGTDHPDTLTSMNNVALTYRRQGLLVDAEKLEVQVIETRKKKLGTDRPDTLTSMVNLAFTWKAQGRSKEAITLMRQCVEQRQRVLRVGHPDLTSSIRVLKQWEGNEETQM
jgi:hypothetical protein